MTMLYTLSFVSFLLLCNVIFFLVFFFFLVCCYFFFFFFFFQAEDGIRDLTVTGVQTCALPICRWCAARRRNILARRRDEWRTWSGRAVVLLGRAAVRERGGIVAVRIHFHVIGLEGGTRLRWARAAPTTGRASAFVHATSVSWWILGGHVHTERAPYFLWGFS